MALTIGEKSFSDVWQQVEIIQLDEEPLQPEEAKAYAEDFADHAAVDASIDPVTSAIILKRTELTNNPVFEEMFTKLIALNKGARIKVTGK